MSAILLSLSLLAGSPGDISAFIEDDNWKKQNMPDSQVCNKFGGTGGTPPFKVINIPSGVTSLIFSYSDLDYGPMSNGGHGVLEFPISGESSVSIPSVPGNTFEIGDKATSISEHIAPDWDKAGAYLPPCSGGQKHRYSVKIKAMKNAKVISETDVLIGIN